MWSLVVLAVLAALTIGLMLKLLLDRRPDSSVSITWVEFALVSLCGLPFILLITTPIGWKLSMKHRVSFNQFLNGRELEAVCIKTKCTRDGACMWTYRCDPYQVPYECGSTECSGSGSTRSCRYVSRTCYRTEYHSCPYVDEERTYIVRTTIGDYTIAAQRLPDNPNSRRWRKSEPVPASIIERAGVGTPKRWAEADERIRAGRPGPATKRVPYDNYILASKQTILKSHSSAVQRYRELGLLPPIANEVYDFYRADKVAFVGTQPMNPRAWQNHLQYFNAVLGEYLEGDLHLVIVRDSTITDPDEYALALRAHWQDEATFGKDALPKNAIVVVLGTVDGETVAWSRAFTGMPLGNELMLQTLAQTLRGLPLDPVVLLGDTTTSLVARPAPVPAMMSAIERIMFGADNAATRFQRISMSGQGPDDVGNGFGYLLSEIQPTTKHKIILFAIDLVLASVLWTIVIFLDIHWPGHPRYRRW